MRHIAGTKSEYVAFIQVIFNDESDAGTNDDSKQDIVATTVSSNDQFLSADVGRGGDHGKEGVDESELHRARMCL